MPERRRKSYLGLAGHPIHALSVPVPIGFYIASSIAAFVAQAKPKDSFWPRAWRLSGTAAVGSSGTVAVAGLVDYLTIVRGRRAKRVGFAHLVLNSSALALQVYALLKAGRDGRRRAMLQSGVLGLVSGAGFLGGDLVYRHRVGVFGRERQQRRRVRSNASYYVPATD